MALYRHFRDKDELLGSYNCGFAIQEAALPIDDGGGVDAAAEDHEDLAGRGALRPLAIGAGDDEGEVEADALRGDENHRVVVAGEVSAVAPDAVVRPRELLEAEAHAGYAVIGAELAGGHLLGDAGLDEVGRRILGPGGRWG